MKKIIKTTKILVQWIESMPNGNAVIQTRKYNDENKADLFIDNLPARGITNCTKKITRTINFEEE